MYEDVLIAADTSEGTKEATKHGLAIAEELGATVHVLSVAAEEHRDHLRFDPEEEAHEAIELVERAAEDRSVILKTAVREGVPEDEILGYVDENDVDVVVLGTHGRSGLDRIISGSVAEAVGRESPAPVLTVGVNGE